MEKRQVTVRKTARKKRTQDGQNLPPLLVKNYLEDKLIGNIDKQIKIAKRRKKRAEEQKKGNS